MRLEITNQTNEQECGVCAITSLHNYFYKEKIGKEELLDKSNITTTGMNIFDFEVLAKTAGLECESYEVQYSEFIKLKLNNYCVALVRTTDGLANHYVIVKKHKKQITIYDSCSVEEKNLSYDQFQKIFLNVVILVSKKPNKAFNKVFGNSKTLLLLDLKFVLLNLFISCLILLTSVAAASFLNWIIDLSILKSSINNLFTISFIFVLIYFSNDLLTYISNLYISGHMKNYYLLFTNKLLSALQNKSLDFLYKVDKNWIYKVDECVYNISNFCVAEINKLITNIIFCSICICIIGSLQPWLLIFVILFALAEFIPFLFSYRKKKELFTQIVRTENKNTHYYKKLIKNLGSEIWPSKRRFLTQVIKDNYSQIYKNFNDVTIFKANNNLAKSLSKSFIEICMVVCSAYLIIKNKNLSIGKLTFVIASFSLFKNSVSDIFNYFLAKIEFDVYWQVYKDITSVGNLNENKIKQIKNIKSIQFTTNNQVFILDTHKRINLIPKPINSLLLQTPVIKINDVDVDKNSKEFIENTIVIDEHSSANTQMLLSMIEKQPELFSSYLRCFDIDLYGLLSIEQQIIVNLLLVITQQNKLIIIDSVLDYINDKNKLVVKEILNKIRSNNSLFIVGKVKHD